MEQTSTIFSVTHTYQEDIRSMLQDDASIIMMEATTAAEGLHTLYHHTPDIILIEIDLPDQSGFDVCRHIRDISRLMDVPVVLIGTEYEQLWLDVRLAGADDVFLVPLNADAVQMRIQMIARINRRCQLHTAHTRYEQLIDLSPESIVMVDITALFASRMWRLAICWQCQASNRCNNKTSCRLLPPNTHTIAPHASTLY